MKLRNKKTGEIIELLAKPSFVKRNDDFLQSEINTFNSLAELSEKWEDYEEPKEYWAIDCFSPDGCISKFTGSSKDILSNRKEIGNYFETKEEAEKAVEKLKAWKRLKDKGFRFTGLAGISNSISFTVNKKYESSHVAYDPYVEHDYDINEYILDLDLLFGGKE